MYILDTDHLSLIQRNGQEGRRILERLKTVEEHKVAVTIITYEEQVRGRLGVVSKSKKLDEQIRAYQWLQKLLENYRTIEVLPFNRAAIVEHQRLRRVYPRLGNMNLKIAAISLVKDATLLSRNTSDFSQINGLVVENWSG